MNEKDKEFYDKSLGKWHSWDSPIGLAIGLIGMSFALVVLVEAIKNIIELF